jgi:hypothetical protein
MGKEKSDPYGNPTGQTSGEIDARMYKMMFEFDRRLEDKFKEARSQNKEDIKTAIELAISPVFHRLDNIDGRFDAGNKRFVEQDARATEHSDRIDNALELVRMHKENCPARPRPSDKSGDTTKTNKKPAWWLVLLAGGALAFVGERATKFVVNGMADPPSIQSTAKP